MTIAMDADDTAWVRSRLREAAGKIGGVVPGLPGPAAFGPANLASAVAAFDDAVRRDARDLHDRWAALEDAVGATFDEFTALETGFATEMKHLGAPLA